jgi:hypothetical protein
VAFAANARGAAMSLTVEQAFDNATGLTHDAASAEVASLNEALGAQHVTVSAFNWYSADFISGVPVGATITSATVTVQYRMDVAWTGSALLRLREGAAILAADSVLESNVLATKTWDVTALVNGRPDPVAAANDLGVMLINFSGDDPIEWYHARLDIDLPNEAAVKPSVISPAEGDAGVSRNPTVASGAFVDTNAHASSDWELYEDDSLGVLVAWSYADADNLESIAVDASSVTFGGPLEGKTMLDIKTEYWARVRHTDEGGVSSEWSDTVGFITTAEPPHADWSYFGSGCAPSACNARPSLLLFMLLSAALPAACRLATTARTMR